MAAQPCAGLLKTLKGKEEKCWLRLYAPESDYVWCLCSYAGYRRDAPHYPCTKPRPQSTALSTLLSKIISEDLLYFAVDVVGILGKILSLP